MHSGHSARKGRHTGGACMLHAAPELRSGSRARPCGSVLEPRGSAPLLALLPPAALLAASLLRLPHLMHDAAPCDSCPAHAAYAWERRRAAGSPTASAANLQRAALHAGWQPSLAPRPADQGSRWPEESVRAVCCPVSAMARACWRESRAASEGCVRPRWAAHRARCTLRVPELRTSDKHKRSETARQQSGSQIARRAAQRFLDSALCSSGGGMLQEGSSASSLQPPPCTAAGLVPRQKI